MSRIVTGIEFTAHCPRTMPQYKANKLNVEMDGEGHPAEWDRPIFLTAGPGVHRISASIRGLLMNAGSRSLDITVESDQIIEVNYTLTMLSLINPGKLTVTGKRPANVSPLKCSACGHEQTAGARCGKCGVAIQSA